MYTRSSKCHWPLRAIVETLATVWPKNQGLLDLARSKGVSFYQGQPPLIGLCCIIVLQHASNVVALLRKVSSTDVNSVIALTGIGAHAFRSFKNREMPHMWLRDDLPRDLPNSHVMIWGYDATVFKSKDTQSIQDISRQLQHDLSQISESARSRPYIFIAHSLGGLILKKVCGQKPMLSMSCQGKGFSLLRRKCQIFKRLGLC